jgi:hypothetical protein
MFVERRMTSKIASIFRLAVAFYLLLSLLVGQPAMGLDYWVSTTGGDTNPGTKEKPFATLERARDAIRETKRTGPLKTEATVWLSGGTYWIDKTFKLDAQDSGTAEAPAVYRSAPGEKAHLVGGKQIPSTAFKLVGDTETLNRLASSARGKVMHADLKAFGVTDYGRLTRRGGIERNILPAALELFFNDQPMPLARWPNAGYVKIAAVPEGAKGTRFTYDGDRPKRWARADDIWVHGYFNRNWCDTYENVAAINTAKHEITTQEPHDYRGYKAGQRIRFLNLLEELDEPGEWYLDRNTGTLYFWPPEPIEKGRIWISLLETPLVELRGTAYVTLRGLIPECTRGSGVEIVGGHHNLVAGCTLRNIGTVGVAIGGVVEDLERRLYRDTMFKCDAGTDNGVVSCDIYDTGECGVILSGGDRKTLESGRNYAVNNHIYNFSRWVRTYRPAVFLCGVGNRVAHNLIHDAPHTAVFFLGNDHVLEFNDVYRVCTETGDAGAFYTGRDWSQRGSVVRYNYFHDLGATLEGGSSFSGVMGVYLDDQASGITVFGNIFSRVNRAVLLGGGRHNTLENNIFAFCDRVIHLDARGVGDTFSNSKTLLDRLKAANHDRPPYSERYPMLAEILNDEPGKPKGNVIARNICVGGPWDVFNMAGGQEFVRTLVKIEDNLTEGDPGLVAPEKGDFRLKDDSPALKLGFKPIPVEKTGLYQDEYR